MTRPRRADLVRRRRLFGWLTDVQLAPASAGTGELGRYDLLHPSALSGTTRGLREHAESICAPAFDAVCGFCCKLSPTSSIDMVPENQQLLSAADHRYSCTESWEPPEH